MPADPDTPEEFLRAMGFLTFGSLAVRADIVERLASRAWSLSKSGSFPVSADLMSLAGCGPEDMAEILKGLGYRGRKDKKGVIRFRHQEARSGAKGSATGEKRKTGKMAKSSKSAGGKKPKAARRGSAEKDSPFAKLRELPAVQGK